MLRDFLGLCSLTGPRRSQQNHRPDLLCGFVGHSKWPLFIRISSRGGTAHPRPHFSTTTKFPVRIRVSLQPNRSRFPNVPLLVAKSPGPASTEAPTLRCKPVVMPHDQLCLDLSHRI